MEVNKYKILLIVILDNRKIYFHFFFNYTAPDQKKIVLALIYIYPDSRAMRRLFYQIHYFSVDGCFESDEKVSGLPTNPEKFDLV